MASPGVVEALVGMSGIGKTMVASAVAARLKKLGLVEGAFFMQVEHLLTFIPESTADWLVYVGWVCECSTRRTVPFWQVIRERV